MAQPQRSNPELDLIAQIHRRFPQDSNPRLRLGIGDDCAILQPLPGQEVLVTTDFTLEDRHFRRDTHPAFAVGHRTLARGLSDLAAMGATPLTAFLSIALPSDLPRTASGRRWIGAFLDGLKNLAAYAKVSLAGGDTAQAPGPQILADIVLLGVAPTGTALRRSTAQAGDDLYLSGHIGGAAAELRTLLARPASSPASFARNPPPSSRNQAAHPQLFPQPRLAVGHVLRRRSLATACIDLSDGLATDLTHLCEASNVRAAIDASSLPIHPLALALGPDDARNLAFRGGEDYELLFTANPATCIPRRIAGVPITRIGRLLDSSPRHPRITMEEPGFASRPLRTTRGHHFSG